MTSTSGNPKCYEGRTIRDIQVRGGSLCLRERGLLCAHCLPALLVGTLSKQS